MTSAFNVVLNLACIWLLFIIMADVRKIRDSGKLSLFRAKAELDLRENGSVIPRPKGKARHIY